MQRIWFSFLFSSFSGLLSLSSRSLVSAMIAGRGVHGGDVGVGQDDHQVDAGDDPPSQVELAGLLSSDMTLGMVA